MSLANGMEKVGILDKIVHHFHHLQNYPFIFSLLIIAFCIVIMTEIMSNVALAAIALPLLLAWAKSHGHSLEIVGLLVALATSFGFSLPMSTPPNAIVFGTGEIRFKEMLFNGWILNLATTAILVLCAYYWWPLVLGVS